jgi:apolipoprotein D and lipocalin family protein
MKWLFLAFLVLFSCLACVSATKRSIPPLRVVPHADLMRYTGTWYEIASFPQRFEKGCVGSRATYTLLPDGKIEVLNECRKGSFDGKISSVKGKAWVADKDTNAKLKVSFFWPFSGDYWIIDLGKDYEYVVVGHPDRRYLWVLSRTREMDEALYGQIIEKLQGQFYDTSKLVKTPQVSGKVD